MIGAANSEATDWEGVSQPADIQLDIHADANVLDIDEKRMCHAIAAPLTRQAYRNKWLIIAIQIDSNETPTITCAIIDLVI